MPSPDISHYVRLIRFVDRAETAGVSLREIRALSDIAHHPGTDGISVAGRLGLPPRQQIHGIIAGLTKAGLIEDRREEELRGVPKRLYVTPHGRQFILHLFREPADDETNGALSAGD